MKRGVGRREIDRTTSAHVPSSLKKLYAYFLYYSKIIIIIII